MAEGAGESAVQAPAPAGPTHQQQQIQQPAQQQQQKPAQQPQRQQPVQQPQQQPAAPQQQPAALLVPRFAAWPQLTAWPSSRILGIYMQLPRQEVLGSAAGPRRQAAAVQPPASQGRLPRRRQTAASRLTSRHRQLAAQAWQLAAVVDCVLPMTAARKATVELTEELTDAGPIPILCNTTGQRARKCVPYGWRIFCMKIAAQYGRITGFLQPNGTMLILGLHEWASSVHALAGNIKAQSMLMLQILWASSKRAMGM